MSQTRYRLINQVKVLYEYLETHAFDEDFTDRKASMALRGIENLWKLIERRTK